MARAAVTQRPTRAPTVKPTPGPTGPPTAKPSMEPSVAPSGKFLFEGGKRGVLMKSLYLT